MLQIMTRENSGVTAVETGIKIRNILSFIVRIFSRNCNFNVCYCRGIKSAFLASNVHDFQFIYFNNW
jgi:hypothetical protein